MERSKGKPPNPKINDVILVKMLEEGRTYKACAKEFGVSEYSIKSRVITLRKKMSSPPAIPGDEDKAAPLNALEQLNTINGTITEQLKRCNLLLCREESSIKKLDDMYEEASNDATKTAAEKEVIKAMVEKNWGSSVKNILAIQTNLISSSGEIRKQVELQLKIAEALYNVQAMQEFQSEIIDLLRELDPVIAQRFVNKMKERKTIRGLIKG